MEWIDLVFTSEGTGEGKGAGTDAGGVAVFRGVKVGRGEGEAAAAVVRDGAASRSLNRAVPGAAKSNLAVGGFGAGPGVDEGSGGVLGINSRAPVTEADVEAEVGTGGTGVARFADVADRADFDGAAVNVEAAGEIVVGVAEDEDTLVTLLEIAVGVEGGAADEAVEGEGVGGACHVAGGGAADVAAVGLTLDGEVHDGVGVLDDDVTGDGGGPAVGVAAVVEADVFITTRVGQDDRSG